MTHLSELIDAVDRQATEITKKWCSNRDLLNTILATYCTEKLRTIHVLFLWNTDALDDAGGDAPPPPGPDVCTGKKLCLQPLTEDQP